MSDDLKKKSNMKWKIQATILAAMVTLASQPLPEEALSPAVLSEHGWRPALKESSGPCGPGEAARKEAQPLMMRPLVRALPGLGLLPGGLLLSEACSLPPSTACPGVRSPRQ